MLWNFNIKQLSGLTVSMYLLNIFDRSILILFYRDPENILRTLAPMFEIDFYLPRAFMSILRLEKLTVVKTKLLPPEVVMASLYFFSKTEYFGTDLKKKVIDFSFWFYITFNLLSHLSWKLKYVFLITCCLSFACL